MATTLYRDVVIDSDHITWDDIFALYGQQRQSYTWIMEKPTERVRFLLRHTEMDIKIRNGDIPG